MPELQNRQIRLIARSVGLPTPANWTLTEEAVPDPAEGGVIVRVQRISLDPAMRSWMNEGRSYIPPVGLGEIMRAGGVGQVVASRSAAFPVGSHVSGMFGVQDYCHLEPAAFRRAGLTPIDLALGSLDKWLNPLGMPGLTGYLGLVDIGVPKAGETVLISGAAGAVGQMAGQVAKILGCRAVGIAGGPDKCAYVTDELGFDAAVDYKAGPVRDGLKLACPDGVHVYFDNVGGEILDAALARLARGARVVICGGISQYNATTIQGPKNYLQLLVMRARMEGFVVFDWADRFPEAIRTIAGWMAEGRLRSREHVVVGGVEQFPETLNLLFTGQNFGKLLLNIDG